MLIPRRLSDGLVVGTFSSRQFARGGGGIFRLTSHGVPTVEGRGGAGAGPPPPADLTESGGYLDEFCAAFGEDRRELLAERFWVLTPDGENLYRRLYTSV